MQVIYQTDSKNHSANQAHSFLSHRNKHTTHIETHLAKTPIVITVSVYYDISLHLFSPSQFVFKRDGEDTPFLCSKQVDKAIPKDSFTVLSLDSGDASIKHADTPQRLTNRHIFIDEKVG